MKVRRGSPRFACGFTIFIERGELHEEVVSRLVEELRRVSPTSLEDSDYERLKVAATTWILFNFSPALDALPVPKKIKDAVKSSIGRIVALMLAAQEFAIDFLFDESLGVPLGLLPPL